jgi:HEPN domain-containing protein
MGRADEIELMRRRAKVFLDTAKYLFQRGDYDIASFNAEQATQLSLKSVLLLVVGDYPRTHSAIALLNELKRIDGEDISRFIEDNRLGLRSLEDAYLTSRYFYRSFEKEDAKYLISLTEKVVELCENIRHRMGKN